MSRADANAANSEYQYQYNWVDGAETLERYRPGGYHPIMIGGLLHDRYYIVDKLGFGGYSTYVALKVGIADSILQEPIVLRALTTPLLSLSSSSSYPIPLGRNSIPQTLDEFELNGPNGKHLCYTMPPARRNLRDVSFSCLFPLDVARALSGGRTTAITYMHSRGYAHGDIHLRNILTKLPSSFDHLTVEKLYEEYSEPETVPITLRDGDGRDFPPNVPAEAVLPLDLGIDAEEFSLADSHLILSDFGEAFAPDSHVRLGKDCHTPLPMRPPEARFEPSVALSYSADIWSLGFAIWETLGMKALFSVEFGTADELVSQYIDVLGPMPQARWESWEERGRFFEDDNQSCPKKDRYVWPPIDQAFEDGIQHYRKKRKMGDFGAEETAAILDVMRRMLAFRPEERPSAAEVLQSEWMVKWVLPDYERSLRSQ
ncbi:kinase domain protein [Aspergillus uvarum CBS 121591]|uniref:non-specific serine/threonine protein kinase n=1 Tax=Aspergillus uvarum CBS 121591 TaxID=1448315 RepID=A0A319C828_9EURO|nr:kinase domain protein [Aspergillus uvarum CBS 121591]PYH81545.1 kinase domain protein [Aspergillus uvarum CBS 121591]